MINLELSLLIKIFIFFCFDQKEPQKLTDVLTIGKYRWKKELLTIFHNKQVLVLVRIQPRSPLRRELKKLGNFLYCLSCACKGQ
jgi:hypothetical protein